MLNLSGYSLGGHNWNQLPAGLFDGLDSLEVLDLSDTNLQNLNRRIFDGLDTLVELDLSDTLLDSTAVPVGVFDGLDSLEILRIANAGYRGRGINFVDEDIFRGLDTLRELDARPIRPSDDVLAPLTSLERLNGRATPREPECHHRRLPLRRQLAEEGHPEGGGPGEGERHHRRGCPRTEVSPTSAAAPARSPGSAATRLPTFMAPATASRPKPPTASRSPTTSSPSPQTGRLPGQGEREPLVRSKHPHY